MTKAERRSVGKVLEVRFSSTLSAPRLVPVFCGEVNVQCQTLATEHPKEFKVARVSLPFLVCVAAHDPATTIKWHDLVHQMFPFSPYFFIISSCHDFTSRGLRSRFAFNIKT